MYLYVFVVSVFMYPVCPISKVYVALVGTCACVGVVHVGVVCGSVMFNEVHVAMFGSSGVCNFVFLSLYIILHVILVKA